MIENDIVAEIRRGLCDIYGYDENFKYVGKKKAAQRSLGAKRTLQPRDFLNFASADSALLAAERNRINCLGNCKRAIDSQIDLLISQLGFFPLARRQRWNIPRKLEFISRRGVVAPRILRRVTELRNRLEHDFSLPSQSQVEDVFDVAALFVSYAELVRMPCLNVSISERMSVKYDYENMVFRFFDGDLSSADQEGARPRTSISYGQPGFQEFYDFLVRVVPIMERKGDVGDAML
jgi:hypothetical protein